MASSNPAMGVLDRAASGEFNFGGLGETATLSGTTTKSIFLVAITFIVGYGSMIYSLGYIIQNQATPSLLMYGSIIAAVVVAMIAIFKPQSTPITAPLYAICEGAGLGTLSAVFEFKYPGIVATAVMSTFVVLMAMLALWKFRLIVPTARFRSIVIGATCGIAILYLLYTFFVRISYNMMSRQLFFFDAAMSMYDFRLRLDIAVIALCVFKALISVVYMCYPLYEGALYALVLKAGKQNKEAVICSLALLFCLPTVFA